MLTNKGQMDLQNLASALQPFMEDSAFEMPAYQLNQTQAIPNIKGKWVELQASLEREIKLSTSKKKMARTIIETENKLKKTETEFNNVWSQINSLKAIKPQLDRLKQLTEMMIDSSTADLNLTLKTTLLYREEPTGMHEDVR